MKNLLTPDSELAAYFDENATIRSRPRWFMRHYYPMVYFRCLIDT